MPLPGMQVYGSAFTNADAAGANPVTSRQLAHGFVRQHDAAFHHQLFDVLLAQAEAEVQPHGVGRDDPPSRPHFGGQHAS
jgi:hypothetical protein